MVISRGNENSSAPPKARQTTAFDPLSSAPFHFSNGNACAPGAVPGGARNRSRAGLLNPQEDIMPNKHADTDRWAALARACHEDRSSPNPIPR